MLQLSKSTNITKDSNRVAIPIHITNSKSIRRKNKMTQCNDSSQLTYSKNYTIGRT